MCACLQCVRTYGDGPFLRRACLSRSWVTLINYRRQVCAEDEVCAEDKVKAWGADAVADFVALQLPRNPSTCAFVEALRTSEVDGDALLSVVFGSTVEAGENALKLFELNPPPGAVNRIQTKAKREIIRGGE